MSNSVKKQIPIKDLDSTRRVFGNLDKNVKIIEKELDLLIRLEDNNINIYGKDDRISLGEEIIIKLLEEAKEENKDYIEEARIRNMIDLVLSKDKEKSREFLESARHISISGRIIKARTLGQKRYIDTMFKEDVVFGIGPAGSGKTFLAIAMGVKLLKMKKVERIIITRPVVEAGENLGFLPGDLQEKVDPYLRPIYDSLFNILGEDSFNTYMERGLIEIAPLAYMRGRTLESAFILLDEAQNTTREQMKMFLTRIGFNSQTVITGDITQTDLPRGKKSGLKEAINVLKDIEGIGFVYLSKSDIVRHHLVEKIVGAYEEYEKAGDRDDSSL